MKELFRLYKEWIIYIWHRFIIKDVFEVTLNNEFKIDEILMLSAYNNVRSLVIWVKKKKDAYVHYLRRIR